MQRRQVMLPAALHCHAEEIHFADGQTQQWLMVRMPESAGQPKQ